MGNNFRDEWARRVGERLLNGEGFDPEADQPLYGPSDPYRNPDGTRKQPPAAEASTETEEAIEWGFTKAEYEELIALRVKAGMFEEMATLRARKAALEVDVEEAYDRLDAEEAKIRGLEQSIAFYKTGEQMNAKARDQWMDAFSQQVKRREALDAEIDQHKAARTRTNRIAVFVSALALGSVVGSGIVAWRSRQQNDLGPLVPTTAQCAWEVRSGR